MSSFSPFEPDFQSLHDRGLADRWWSFAMLFGLVTAGIPAIVAHETIGTLWLTGLIAVVSYAWFFAHGLHLGWKERTVLALDEQDLDARIWAASRAQQIGRGFESVGSYIGYEMLARPIGEDTPDYTGHEFIVRSSKDTVAVANVIRIHDAAYWPLAMWETLELNGAQISLSSVFEQSDVRSRVAQAQIAKSDFICIGLTSHKLETVGGRGSEFLSDQRAKALGEALISFAGLDHKRSGFYAIGLGQAHTFVEDGESSAARNQRSAVVLAITRRQDIQQILELDRVTEALIQNYRTDRIDLSNYEFSSDIANRLSASEIDFAGFV